MILLLVLCGVVVGAGSERVCHLLGDIEPADERVEGLRVARTDVLLAVVVGALQPMSPHWRSGGLAAWRLPWLTASAEPRLRVLQIKGEHDWIRLAFLQADQDFISMNFRLSGGHWMSVREIRCGRGR